MIKKRSLKKHKTSRKQKTKIIFKEYKIESVWEKFIKIDPFVPKWPWEV